MRTLAFVSGAFSGTFIGLGMLFKIQHWPMASIFLILGLGAFSLLFIPSMAKHLYDVRK